MMQEIFIYCTLFGGIAGLLAGLFGIGGGVVLVPFFLWLFTKQEFPQETVMHSAIATSLATIIVTAIASVTAHHRLGSVIWEIVYKLAPGVFIGATVGATLADHFPTESLRLFFAAYLFIVGIEMAFQWQPKQAKAQISFTMLRFFGLVIGILSSILGIGGGTLTVPLLSRYNYPMRNAVAISSACGLPIAISSTLSFAVLGWDKAGLPEGSIGYVYWPAFVGIILTSTLMAPVGAKLAHKLPTKLLKRFFSLLVFAITLKMVW
jgi:uncharacterized membrane protein YfcA